MNSLTFPAAGRFLRAVKTIGGTDNPSYTGCLNLLAVED